MLRHFSTEDKSCTKFLNVRGKKIPEQTDKLKSCTPLGLDIVIRKFCWNIGVTWLNREL